MEEPCKIACGCRVGSVPEARRDWEDWVGLGPTNWWSSQIGEPKPLLRWGLFQAIGAPVACQLVLVTLGHLGHLNAGIHHFFPLPRPLHGGGDRTLKTPVCNLLLSIPSSSLFSNWLWNPSAQSSMAKHGPLSVTQPTR